MIDIPTSEWQKNGSEMRGIRRLLDYTQGMAASAIGCDTRTWRRWELGERGIPAPVARLVRLMDRLPVVCEELVKMKKERH